MKKEIFDLVLDFHKELIRATLSEDTVANAEAILVNGDKKLAGIGAQKRSRANSFVKTLESRLATLIAWSGAFACFDTKVKLYCSDAKRTPHKDVFEALNLVLHCDLKTGTAATQCNVNFQSVKALKPRFERYETYAKKLKHLVV